MKRLDEEEIIRHMKDWIQQALRHTPGAHVEITEDTDLIASGVLDSLGFIELMMYLETVTEEKIDLNDVDPSEFTTVSGLCRNVMRQHAGIMRG